MYIEIEPEERAIPQIIVKRDRSSNVIKKSELRCFHETQALLMAMEERVAEYQGILEQQVMQMIEDKEQSLNDHVERAYNDVVDSWMSQQNQWFEHAQSELNELLNTQQSNLNGLKQELKETIATAVTSRLTKLNQSEHLISHLVEVLHAEMDDEAKVLKVEKTHQADGITLTIENEDSIVSIDTATLIAELRASLEQV
ncbi:hypothetical protein ACODM8_16805 [Vibrio ostreicida]|uniref:hypothetical protein n=1 Tax=Vibrio ostreicida TaxID=526588 RepID=UPI003B5AA8D0